MIRRHRRTALLLLSAMLPLGQGCAMYSKDSGKARPAAEAKLLDGTGREGGYVLLTLHDNKLNGVVDVSGLTPGLHAMHIHAVGKCEGPEFKSAGGHLNPDNHQHGTDNPLGAHQGDLPQITVGADGQGHATFIAPTTLAALFDADGASFVIHGGPDDNRTDPSGNSGARLLCGVLTPTR